MSMNWRSEELRNCRVKLEGRVGWSALLAHAMAGTRRYNRVRAFYLSLAIRTQDITLSPVRKRVIS